MGLGLIVAVGFTAWTDRRAGQKRPRWIDGLLITLVAAVIGGRFIFVWANWTYFQDNLNEIGLVWRGGLSYHGALVTGLVALFAWSASKKLAFGDYAGLFAPAFALASVFGWLACWYEGCAYGRETLFGPLAADLPDTYGVFGLRYQTQWMGLILCLFVFLLAAGIRKWLSPILLFLVTLLLLSAGRAIITLYRGDTMPTLDRFRLDTIADIVLVIVSLIIIGIIIVQRLLTEKRTV